VKFNCYKYCIHYSILQENTTSNTKTNDSCQQIGDLTADEADVLQKNLDSKATGKCAHCRKDQLFRDMPTTNEIL
jgi:hypothetical protein